MRYKNLFFFSITIILVLLSTYLIYDNTLKRDAILQQNQDLKSAYYHISDLTGSLSNAIQDINYLNFTLKQRESQISNLNKQVTNYAQELEKKEDVIVNANQEIEKLEEENKYKEAQLTELVKSLQTIGDSKIIQEVYHGTLVLYQNEMVYARMKPLFMQVADDQEDYSRLGIPFFYFKDEQPLTDEEKQILGAYYSLYDYILIYNATNDVRVIYHEIAHIIYKNFFLNNQNNLDIWKADYQILKENNLLSTEYAYTNEQEGFSEEYSIYKTNSNPNQPQEIVQTIFVPVDTFLRS
ncbi:hypothetical protein J4427_03035 [Candidatus Woesearchaeota archaeon]|nr:hypothetical protein [Candidatus Woesearchaeota archaeon]